MGNAGQVLRAPVLLGGSLQTSIGKLVSLSGNGLLIGLGMIDDGVYRFAVL